MNNFENVRITKEENTLSIMDRGFKMTVAEIVTPEIDYVQLMIAEPKTFTINSHSPLSMQNLGIEIFERLDSNVEYFINRIDKNVIRIMPVPVVSENYKRLAALFK